MDISIENDFEDSSTYHLFDFPRTPGRSPAAARKGWPHDVPAVYADSFDVTVRMLRSNFFANHRLARTKPTNR